MFKGKNIYLFNESDNIIWNFASREDSCILCRNFSKSSWSSYEVIAKNCSPKFYLTTPNNNTIYIFYKDFDGNLLFKVNHNFDWSEELLLQKSINDVYTIKFKVIPLDNEVNIIYVLFNKSTHKTIILHQKLYDIYNLSNIEIIDNIDGYHSSPIKIYITKNKELRIIYQKSNDYYELGYKSFNLTSNCWSKFNTIAKDITPFVDYQFLLTSDTSLTESSPQLSSSPHEENYLYYKLKLEEIEKSLNIFNDNKELIQECINYLQENLSIKDKENLKLKEMNLQDNIKIVNLTKEVLYLKEKLNNEDSKLLRLLNNLLSKI